MTTSQALGAALLVPVAVLFIATANVFGMLRTLVIWGAALSTGLAILVAIQLMI